MNQDSDPPIEENKLRDIDEMAQKRSGGDVALYFHLSAVFEGEHRARCHNREALACWLRSKRLAQYRQAEASVIEGWRKFVKNTLGVPAHQNAKRSLVRPSATVKESTLYCPNEQQADDYAINQAIILSTLRRGRDTEQVAALLKERADSIRTFAASGDIDFFRALGRLISAPSRSSQLPAYEYAHVLLSHWLTGFLWLMPERLAADWVARGQGRNPQIAKEADKELRHFKETKHDYGLKSHTPTLIERIKRNGDLVFTRVGHDFLTCVYPSR